MLIVDAQVHLWGADTPERPWPKGAQVTGKHQREPLTADGFLPKMNEAGVDRVVIVPPTWDGKRNDLALEAARRHPDRFAVMGRLWLERPESRAAIVGWRKQPGMLGLRFTFNLDGERPWLTDGTADWLWSACEQEGIPLMVHVPGSVPAIDAIAARHPGLRLVIDHLAIDSSLQDAAAFAHLPQLLALAKRPNVAVKASALPCNTSESYPFRNLHGYIRQVYDAFGPRRMFWGTDWSRLPCSYSEAIRLFTEELPWLSATDKEWIMGRAVCEWLGWPLPAAKR
ncbi:MAG: amidohydrolase [Candidatus Lambdaproteobacteria bacterium]|nr:amidohydrolase [Candidatus Lambdaproteobacteria bacterium]